MPVLCQDVITTQTYAMLAYVKPKVKKGEGIKLMSLTFCVHRLTYLFNISQHFEFPLLLHVKISCHLFETLGK